MQPVKMAALLANSIRRRIAVGSNAGRSVVRLGDQIDGDSLNVESPRCAMVSGFSVHANVCIEARDRMRLERLIRYAARPAVATERLTALADGRLLYRLKRITVLNGLTGNDQAIISRQGLLQGK
jgi:hypothetical protein